MENLIQTLVFKYPKQGKIAEIILPHTAQHLPVLPLCEAMSLKWETQRAKIQTDYRTHLHHFGGRGRSHLCLTFKDITDWLSKLNTKRVSLPETVLHFQQHLPVLLQQIASADGTNDEQDEQEPEREREPEREEDIALPAEYETEILGRVESEKRLKEILNLNRELNANDWVRADLVAVGVRHADEINYLMNAQALVLLKAVQSADGKPQIATMHFSSYERGKLQTAAKNGFFPIPEYFRRNPERYTQQTYFTRRLKLEKGLAWITGVEIAALGDAPWYQEYFQREIQNRLVIAHRISEQAERKRVLNDIKAGKDVFAAFWSEL